MNNTTNTPPSFSNKNLATETRGAIFTRTILLLSFVSLLADIASEMLYPIIPLYLQEIGFGMIGLGLLEGAAGALAGISKGYFGKLSDDRQVRMPFVRGGYLLSALSKPAMVLFRATAWVFAARLSDRLGKGIRTGARDAILSAETSPETKGRVFGFHRAMDTTGAVLGPLLALGLLAVYPQQYRLIFLLSIIPGLLSVLLTFFVKEPANKHHSKAQNLSDNTSKPKPNRFSFFSFAGYWWQSSALYKRLLAGLLVFGLVNSADMFLLVRLRELGAGDSGVIGAYIFFNFVYAIFAYPVGLLADKLGFRPTIAGGLLLFAVVYGGLAIGASYTVAIGLFFIYGIYSAATESVAKAWISNICLLEQTGTAIGTYTAFNSIATLLAGLWTGVVWQNWGGQTALAISAIVAFMAAGYFSLLKNEATRENGV